MSWRDCVQKRNSSGRNLIQGCYTFAAPLLFMATRRVSFSVSPETIEKLSALAKWQHRTPSQQIDALVCTATASFYDTLTPEQQTQFSAQLCGETL